MESEPQLTDEQVKELEDEARKQQEDETADIIICRKLVTAPGWQWFKDKVDTMVHNNIRFGQIERSHEEHGCRLRYAAGMQAVVEMVDNLIKKGEMEDGSGEDDGRGDEESPGRS